MQDKFTITFIDGIDGSVSNILYVEKGECAVEPTPKIHGKMPDGNYVVFEKWINVKTGKQYLFDEVYDDMEIKSSYKKAYEVRFVDSFNGQSISKQIIQEHGKAKAPEIPSHDTFIGIGWYESFSDIVENIEVHPIFIDVTKMLKQVIGHFNIGNLKDIVAILNSLYNIFTWIQGERILLPEFGSELRKLLYEGITDYNIERIIAEIRHCVSIWEPRVLIDKIVNIGTVDDTEDNTVHLQIIYMIPGLTTDKFVYDLDYYRR